MNNLNAHVSPAVHTAAHSHELQAANSRQLKRTKLIDKFSASEEPAAIEVRVPLWRETPQMRRVRVTLDAGEILRV